MPSYIGDVTAVQSEFGYDSDPLRGDSYVYVFNGSEASIRLAAASWKNLGARVSVANEGSLWKLRVFVGVETGGTEVPVDVWETDTELAHEDFYASLKVLRAYILAYGTAAETTLANHRKQIEDAVAAGTPLDTALVTGNDPIQALYNERVRGTEATEVERPVIRRVRFVSPQYASPAVVEAIPRVWTTSALVRDFAIPNLIQIKLPPDPDFTVVNTAWGWKRRQNDSRFHAPIAKFEESMSWYFAAWSTIRYDVVT